MVGAPAMCAHSAFRCGAGLVKIAAEREVVTHALVIEPSATGVVLEGDLPAKLRAIESADPESEAVLAVGPGAGTAEAAGALVMELLKGERRVVLDADGLNLLAATGKPRPMAADAPLVLTPHPGEFRRLAEPLGIKGSPTDPAERPAAAAQLARDHRAIVVLKGQHTIVTDGKRVYVNTTGNAAMATAGSGDVLTGVIAALWAQGMDGFDAAVRGVHLHGRAGDLWAQEHGTSGLLARDLADWLPRAQREARAIPR